jgi:hypothetical protein
MNDVMHDLLNKLRIIGKVREGQKLDVANGLHVYSDSWINWIMRKWNRDNKDEGIRCILDLYKSLGQSVEVLINDTKTAKNDIKKSSNIYVMINIASNIKNSIKGLDNLAKTYNNYPSTTSAIEGIVKDYVIVIYNSLIDNIPKDKLLKELSDPILFMGNTIYEGSINDINYGINQNELNNDDI